MVKRLVVCTVGLAGLLLAQFSAAQSEPPAISTTRSQIPEEAIGQRFGRTPLAKMAKDPTYGYSKDVPVPVGGGFGEGSHNVYRYLNALLGPDGQVVHYVRVGTCCPFKTPKSPFDGEGLLEVYEVSYEGGKPVRLYFNWYESGELCIPKGLTAPK